MTTLQLIRSISWRHTPTMALHMRLSSRCPAVPCRKFGIFSTSSRSMVTVTGRQQQYLHRYPSAAPNRQQRAFTNSVPRRIAGQEVPNAHAYISSGILAGPKDLVDVKKVLVIGSGGLSIGQAGEFDYSGRIPYFLPWDITRCVQLAIESRHRRLTTHVISISQVPRLLKLSKRQT